MPNAGTMVEVFTRPAHDLDMITLTCQTDSDHAFQRPTDTVRGDLRMVVVVPPTSGSYIPTAAAILTFLDENGIDVMGGSVRSALGQFFPKIGTASYAESRRCNDALTVVLTNNTVDSAIFTVILFVTPQKNLFQ